MENQLIVSLRHIMPDDMPDEVGILELLTLKMSHILKGYYDS